MRASALRITPNCSRIWYCRCRARSAASDSAHDGLHGGRAHQHGDIREGGNDPGDGRRRGAGLQQQDDGQVRPVLLMRKRVEHLADAGHPETLLRQHQRAAPPRSSRPNCKRSSQRMCGIPAVASRRHVTSPSLRVGVMSSTRAAASALAGVTIVPHSPCPASPARCGSSTGSPVRMPRNWVRGSVR